MSPRTAARNLEIRQETIQKIMDAALMLIARQGYETTSIAQIAKEAGTSKGLLYNYFTSKQDLVEQLIRHAMGQYDQVMEAEITTDAASKLENIFRHFFKELRDRPDYWRLLTELMLKIDQFKFVRDFVVEKMDAYIMLLQQLLEQRGFEDPGAEAKLIAALFDGISVQAVVIREAYPLDDLERILIQKYCKR